MIRNWKNAVILALTILIDEKSRGVVTPTPAATPTGADPDVVHIPAGEHFVS